MQHDCHHPHTRFCVDHRRNCCNKIEIIIEPANSKVYFSDEAYVDPVNTQTRFSATVFNSSSTAVKWLVSSANGGPGAGSIDAYGLYTAPNKGLLANGYTDVVTAISLEDPTRRASALVTVQGEGPEPVAESIIEIYPKRVNLYFRHGAKNQYIDACNKSQRFDYRKINCPDDEVEWSSSYGMVDINGHYFAPDSGSTSSTAQVKVALKHDPGVYDTAFITLLNYYWPAN